MGDVCTVPGRPKFEKSPPRGTTQDIRLHITLKQRAAVSGPGSENRPFVLERRAKGQKTSLLYRGKAGFVCL